MSSLFYNRFNFIRYIDIIQHHYTGINLNDINDSNVSKPLLYAQTNPSNTDNTVEHRFVTLAQVPTITTKDSANDTLSNISSLRTNETSF